MIFFNYSNINNFFLIMLLTVIFSLSCKHDEDLVVPYVNVTYKLNITNELAYLGVGTYITITRNPNNEEFSIINYHNSKFQNITIAQKSYGNGIIIYRKDFYEYQAFDLTCTYKAFEEYCQLKPDKLNNIIFICPCCSSEFIVTSDGVPVRESKAFKPLMQYNTRIEGNFLLITNN